MGVILAILLRALVAPLVLIASVILSFLCTLGISVLFIRYVVGDAGFDASIPTFAFIFLVALGIDYTIFLMARVREESRHYGTREGMLRALAATGPVITSRRGDPRRHLLGADDAAGHLHLRPRVHGRARDPARHVHRPNDHGPGGGRAARRPDLVAVDGERRRRRCTRTPASTPLSRRAGRPSGHPAQSRVRALLAAGLGARVAVDPDDIGGEVVLAAPQRRAHPVGVDRRRPRPRTARSSRRRSRPRRRSGPPGGRRRRAPPRTRRTSSGVTPRRSDSLPGASASDRRSASPRCRAGPPRGPRRAPRRPRARCRPSRFRSRRGR